MRVLINENRNRTLFEAYHKTDKLTCIWFLSLVVAKLNNLISDADFKKNCKKLKCCLIEDYLPVASPSITASYNLSSSFFEIQYSKSFEKDLKTCTKEDVENFVNDFWVAFIHFKDIPSEVKIKLRNKYVVYIASNPFDLTQKQNLDYYNQVIEADAYGREIAQRLIVDYDIFDLKEIERLKFKSKTDSIFEAIRLGYFEKDEYLTHIYNTYKDPRISKEATRHFFSALYDYLFDKEMSQK